MVAEERSDEDATSVDAMCCNPMFISVSGPHIARSWFASIFQVQHLAAELHVLRTSAPCIVQCCTSLVRQLQAQGDTGSLSRIAGLARLLHSLLLPTSRSTLSVGRVCKLPVESQAQ